MFFFYSRVSTAEQNPSRQLESFKTIGHLKPENVYIDKIQGNVPFFERPEAIKLFEAATVSLEDDTIVIDSIDRLGRNVIDILRTIQVFTDNSINLKSIKEGFQTMVDGHENPMAKIVISVMASIAELERNKIRERQAEGISIAKASGRYKGRKLGSRQSNEKLLSKHAIVVQKLKKGMTIQDIAALTKRSSKTIIKVKKIITQDKYTISA